MTLWSAAVGDAAAAMKEGLSLANQGEARCGCARAGGVYVRQYQARDLARYSLPVRQVYFEKRDVFSR